MQKGLKTRRQTNVLVWKTSPRCHPTDDFPWGVWENIGGHSYQKTLGEVSLKVPLPNLHLIPGSGWPLYLQMIHVFLLESVYLLQWGLNLRRETGEWRRESHSKLPPNCPRCCSIRGQMCGDGWINHWSECVNLIRVFKVLSVVMKTGKMLLKNQKKSERLEF